ncbi:DUF6119 family protein [Amylibacter sp. IMCC11727]|uniref:DUF6119 family protein n=1 Tax=Amylibacter sp. IMCC11727 TaxID=3039851 RepID=UPI00244E5B19|nr:DUF6119 family protein [Amylibacter sp. IMCC11727]WGI21087.1 TIGR04141 family sporadically distributed protein [Amylibacter sp. IMCC11727]
MNLFEDIEETAIGHISFYLASEGMKITDVLLAIETMEKKQNYALRKFVHGENPCEFRYFETGSQKTNPPWLDFVNGQLEDDTKLSFEGHTKSANGILTIGIEERLLIATFGRSPSTYLNKSVLVQDFGVRTAMNMCGNEQIRQVRSQNRGLTTTSVDRQTSRPSDAFSFGLNETEDLKYISANIIGEDNITLQGRSNLTMKVSGKEKLSWDGLIEKCKQFLSTYELDDYKTTFPNYHNLIPATQEQVEELDALLLEALKNEDFGQSHLCIPEFVLTDETAFVFSNSTKTPTTKYSDLKIEQVGNAIRGELTIKKMVNKKIYLYSTIDEKILANQNWSVYDCIVDERKIDDGYFLLSDGIWSKVDYDFYKSIMDFVDHRLNIVECKDEVKNFEIYDPVTKTNRESVFNSKAVEADGKSIKFDGAKLKVGNGLSNKEFCDILSYDDEGSVRIIHCKPTGGASSLSHLFSQAKFYSEAFLTDPVFLGEIREHIRKSGRPSAQNFLNDIPEDIEKVTDNNYSVCLWLLYDKRKGRPDPKNLPLMTLFELKIADDYLRRVRKFKDVSVSFIPVVHSYFQEKKKTRM